MSERTGERSGQSPLARLQALAARFSRFELGILAAVLVPAGLILAFVTLAEEVFEGETLAFDKAILLSLRNPADLADPIGPLWVEIMMRDLTSLGSTTVLTLVTLAVVCYLALAGKRAMALLTAVAVGGGTLLNTVLKTALARPRPNLVAHSVDVYTASFPSGHAALSAATYLTLGALLARVQGPLRLKVYVLALSIALTLAVGASRVYLGVHYPTDVLAGWTVGAAWAIACWVAALWLQRRGKVEGDGDRG